MSPIAISLITLFFLIASFAIGLQARRLLPSEHFNADFMFVMELSVGLIAAMTALVLGLLTASTKSSFDEQDDAIKLIAAKVIEVDRLLARYGGETQEIRNLLKDNVDNRVKNIWNSGETKEVKERMSQPNMASDLMEKYLYNLKPQSDEQKDLRQRVLDLLNDITSARWHAFTNAKATVPFVFLIILVFWLSVLFASFGLISPYNYTAFFLLFLAAISISGGIFVILEMGEPFSGLIKVPKDPIESILLYIGK